MLAFLEACGYMARIAFVLDRIFRKFGLSGKSFIPMLIGTGCGIPGVMASRTIENERDRRMTIMTTTFIPCGAKVPVHSHDRRRPVSAAAHGSPPPPTSSAWLPSSFPASCSRRPRCSPASRSVRYGAAGIPLAHPRQRSSLHVGARLVLHQEGRYHHPAFDHRYMVHHLLRLGRRWCSRCYWRSRSTPPSSPRSATLSGGSFAPGGALAAAASPSPAEWSPRKIIVGTMGIPLSRRHWTGDRRSASRRSQLFASSSSTLLCARCSRNIGAIKRLNETTPSGTWFAIGYQCGFAYLVALMINRFGGAHRQPGTSLGLIAAVKRRSRSSVYALRSL